ncbi:hypothetical protein D3C87_1313750 [compost metagenome]
MLSRLNLSSSGETKIEVIVAAKGFLIRAGADLSEAKLTREKKESKSKIMERI